MKKLLLFTVLAALVAAPAASAKRSSSPNKHYNITVGILSMGSSQVTFQVMRDRVRETDPVIVGVLCTDANGNLIGNLQNYAWVVWDSTGLVGTAGPLPDYADIGATQCQAGAESGSNNVSQFIYFTPA